MSISDERHKTTSLILPPCLSKNCRTVPKFKQKTNPQSAKFEVKTLILS